MNLHSARQKQYSRTGRMIEVYRVCQKMTQLLFCQNFVKSLPNLTIFGTRIVRTIERYVR